MRYAPLILAGLWLVTFGARAADTPEQILVLKNHAFAPSELTVPAGQKIRILVKNEDASPAEFESYELNREKIIPANGEITLYLDALDAGSYPFFDDFHHETTTGKIIAK